MPRVAYCRQKNMGRRGRRGTYPPGRAEVGIVGTEARSEAAAAGSEAVPPGAAQPAAAVSKDGTSPWPGLALAAAIGLTAWFLGRLFPLIGAPVLAIVLGLVMRLAVGMPQAAKAGITFASKRVLQAGIVALGAGFSLQQVWRTGVESLWVMVFTFTAALVSAWALGRWLRVPRNLVNLVGVGTTICGASAIAAVAPIVAAEAAEIAYAISTVFLFNILAVFIFPALGHALGLSDHVFGLWAGTAINDTSSVVAAGYAYSRAAGDYATVVKLTRTTMIIPIALAFALLEARRRSPQAASAGDRATSPAAPAGARLSAGRHLRRIFPWFLLWFLVASALNTLGLLPAVAAEQLPQLGRFLIVVALAAVGFSTDVQRLAATGLRPLLLGLGIWAAVALVGLAASWS